MIGNVLPYIYTGLLCLIDNILEILPFAITQQLLEFSCTPAFHLVYLAGRLLKLLKQGKYLFFLHTFYYYLCVQSYENFPTIPPFIC